MSAGVNVKPVSQNHSGSGIPLPRNMSTFSKQSAKCSGSGLVGPPGQFQTGGRMSSISSSTSNIPPISNSSKDLLKEASSRLLYQQQKSAPHRAQLERFIGSRSAYSSPQIPKRNVLHSKDTLDLPRGSLPQETLKNLARSGNKNWRSGQTNFRSLDNGDVQPASRIQAGRAKEGLHRLKTTNGNLIWGTPSGQQLSLNKQRGKVTNGGTSERQVLSYKPPTQNTREAIMNSGASESPRMAAVAPFRFKLQVQEDTDVASLDDVSDCSSDSMELCCEDLEACHSPVSRTAQA
ncbi:uncharacterized protein [Hoplias malabaricus]|uniref:uncharacterized protein n=1 Tax=Hoplias malabaricus TaxID=27720 RepID=UPI00346247BE